MEDKTLLEIWKRYKWTILLTLTGFIFAICVITYGFFEALFIFICIAAGVYVGIRLDKRTGNKRKTEDPFYHD